MRTLLALIALTFCFSTSFAAGGNDANEKADANTSNNPDASNVTGAQSGYYIFVEDYVNHENHKYLVASKDSVNKIFDHFFPSELSLRIVDHPISIYNLKHSFYIEPVALYEAKNGKTKFKHLKFQTTFKKDPEKQTLKRQQQDPANF